MTGSLHDDLLTYGTFAAELDRHIEAARHGGRAGAVIVIRLAPSGGVGVGVASPGPADIEAAARAMRWRLRVTGPLASIGPGEFAVFLRGAGRDGAGSVARDLLGWMRALVAAGAVARAGVAVFEEGVPDAAAELIRRARLAAKPTAPDPAPIVLEPRQLAPGILPAMRRLATRLALAAALSFAVSPSAGWAQALTEDPGSCLGRIPELEGFPALREGQRMRFGITTGVQTGQFVTGPAAAKPEEPTRTLASLERLRPAGGPLVVRLNRFFWSDGEAGIRHFLDLARRYTDRGYQVELQVRYHPRPDQEGDVAAFAGFVRDVVRRFGRDPGVVGVQIANEVNLEISPDSSDGAYAGARDALIEGVVAAKQEATARGYRGLEIGFNWAYRFTLDSDRAFWAYLGEHGGGRFARSVDWVGLDAYPGTVFPPINSPDGGERGAMVNAMSAIRCYMRIAGLGSEVPIHIGENGFPTSPPARSYERQAEIMRNMIGAAHDFRGTYNVSDYRWFNLRDADSSSPSFQQQYGILRDDYTEKPAFAVYRELVASLGRRAPVGTALRLRIHCSRRGIVAIVSGADGRRVRRVDLFVAGRRVARDSRAPFRRAISRRRLGRGARRLRAAVRYRDGRRAGLYRAIPTCGR